MVISGGLSVLAGASFTAKSASATSSLSTIAEYSAFGAFWFFVSVIALSIRSRHAQR
jgi:competence protein ComGF